MPSPYTWLEAYTPKSEWIGGYMDSTGKAVTSFEGAAPPDPLRAPAPTLAALASAAARAIRAAVLRNREWERPGQRHQNCAVARPFGPTRMK